MADEFSLANGITRYKLLGGAAVQNGTIDNFSYASLVVTGTAGACTIGDTLTDGTSGATGTVAQNRSSTIFLTGVSGTFAAPHTYTCTSGGTGTISSVNRFLHENALPSVSAVRNFVMPTPVPFASLPAGVTGMRHMVSNNSAAPAFLSAANGSGSTKVPVFHNGTSWLVG